MNVNQMLITVIFLSISIRTNDENILKNVAPFFIGFMWYVMLRIKIQNLYIKNCWKSLVLILHISSCEYI